MPTPRKVVVIGSGPAGYVCAIRLRQLGQEVTVVERELVGGVCLNVGCIPSKAMIAAGSFMERVGHASTMGIHVEGMRLELEKLVEWKQSIVSRLTGGVSGLLKNHKARVVMGEASLVDKNTVLVKNAEGEERLTCDDIVIATGSIPIELPAFPFDGKDVWSSTEALAPDRIPEHVVVIGGGYIGLELGIFYQKIGSRVTVLEATPGILPGQDPDCTKVIARSLKKRKIAVHLETFAKGYERAGDKLNVQIEKQGVIETVECDQILSTVGRRPFSGGLGLENVGLATDESGFLTVDAQRRTSVPNIYAVGDIAGQPMLAHKGSKEGLVAAGVIAGQDEAYDVRCVPAVIFTAPEMASVGLQESELVERGIPFKAGRFPFGASGRAMTHLETEGFVKLLAHAETDELLGAHLVGPEVTELVAELTLAIEMGATVEDVGRTIHAHPTLAETVMEAAEAVHGAAVHIFQR